MANNENIIDENADNDGENDAPISQHGDPGNFEETPVRPFLPSHEAVISLADYLTPFEREEITQYPEIYCVGSTAKCASGMEDPRLNGVILKTNKAFPLVIGDHVKYRYEILGFLGKGVSGKVYLAYDWKTKTTVALKSIRHKKLCYDMARKEINVLQHIGNIDPEGTCNVVRLLETFVFRGHTFLVLEKMQQSLLDIIYEIADAGNKMAMWSVQQIAMDLLKPLILFHQQGIVHADVKPENIMKRSQEKMEMAIIDLGTSFFLNETEKQIDYIQSRFYRAPEVLLGHRYGMEIDMWSYGCILAEVYMGRPLFAGESEQHQLALIMEVFGKIPLKMIRRTSDSIREKNFHSNHQPKWKLQKRSLASALDGCDVKIFVDYLTECLHLDPTKRMTPTQALAHRFIAGPL